MRPYEVMAIFEASTEPTVIQGVLDRALETIRAPAATPAPRPLGPATFAYEVNHKREGYYVCEFTGEPRPSPTSTACSALADEVVRHKVVRLPDHRRRRARARGRPAGAGEPADAEGRHERKRSRRWRQTTA